jgi:hypothetical protein
MITRNTSRLLVVTRDQLLRTRKLSNNFVGDCNAKYDGQRAGRDSSMCAISGDQCRFRLSCFLCSVGVRATKSSNDNGRWGDQAESTCSILARQYHPQNTAFEKSDHIKTKIGRAGLSRLSEKWCRHEDEDASDFQARLQFSFRADSS